MKKFTAKFEELPNYDLEKCINDSRFKTKNLNGEETMFIALLQKIQEMDKTITFLRLQLKETISKMPQK